MRKFVINLVTKVWQKAIDNVTRWESRQDSYLLTCCVTGIVPNIDKLLEYAEQITKWYDRAYNAEVVLRTLDKETA